MRMIRSCSGFSSIVTPSTYPHLGRRATSGRSAILRPMVCVSIFYPNDPGKKFDHDYYAASHMPMVMERLKSNGLTRYEIDRGVGGGLPGAPAPFVCVGRLYFNTLDGFQE